MFSKKEIEIYETDHSLSIVVDWFSPIAYFLLFFSMMWCGFLVVWYSIVLAGGAPLIFALFPLLHVAVGGGLAYYTLCLFKNKTYIDLDRNYLSISHKPIPWWRGNKEITTDRIRQIYVKEKVSRGKNGTSVTYELRAKLTDNSDEHLFNLQSLEAHEVIDIEERIECFLGITDEAVRGEYGTGKVKIPASDTPRRQQKRFSLGALDNMYFSDVRTFRTIKGTEQQVMAITQYDWNNGDSDKFFQLENQSTETLLYLEQNKAFLTAFEEQLIPIGRTGLTLFPKENPPATIQMDGQQYFYKMSKKGDAFITGISRKVAVEQWLYESEHKKQQLRFMDYDGQLTCYLGSYLPESEFESTLDLNSAPPMREEERLRNLDEEDFV